ncbi:MAG: VWA domain-containing protein [Proteobacteria bacterium]|nr:VWA domain-containing protein [Pseudomonadota bacterium]MBU1585288.1 VWA domain-containing protein [Pseudomonadota bacterium]MBU2455969.1 VWA domain-containing protein [Pseudomonadota bacterium]
MTFTKSFYQKTGLIFFVWVALVFMPGVAGAIVETSKVICRVETDKRVLLAGDSQNVVLKITLDAPSTPSHMKRPPVNLSLVLDQSGSMNGNKIEQAKAAAIEALTRLGLQDIFSVVVYDTNVHTIVPAQNASHIQNIIRTIRQIRAGGSTALFGGVSQGAAEIRKNIENDYIHRIILLSDGLANVGPRMPEDLGRLGAALIKENISVTTVGVGTDYNEDLMARLAQKSDGNTYFVESGFDLPKIFAAELGDVLNVVAKKVKVTITLPDNVTAVNIIGREGRIKGREIELFMNQLYGDQEKYALIEVNIPKSISGSRIKIAQAEVTYENPFTQKQETSTGISYASFSSDLKKVVKSTNIDVVKEYQLNLNALAQEKAIVLSDKGEKKEAARTLKQSAEKLKQMGYQYNDKDLLEEANELEVQAEKIEDQGMDKKSRKLLRTKSYQQKNQQLSK